MISAPLAVVISSSIVIVIIVALWFWAGSLLVYAGRQDSLGLMMQGLMGRGESLITARGLWR